MHIKVNKQTIRITTVAVSAALLVFLLILGISSLREKPAEETPTAQAHGGPLPEGKLQLGVSSVIGGMRGAPLSRESFAERQHPISFLKRTFLFGRSREPEAAYNQRYLVDCVHLLKQRPLTGAETGLLESVNDATVQAIQNVRLDDSMETWMMRTYLAILKILSGYPSLYYSFFIGIPSEEIIDVRDRLLAISTSKSTNTNRDYLPIMEFVHKIALRGGSDPSFIQEMREMIVEFDEKAKEFVPINDFFHQDAVYRFFFVAAHLGPLPKEAKTAIIKAHKKGLAICVLERGEARPIGESKKKERAAAINSSLLDAAYFIFENYADLIRWCKDDLCEKAVANLKMDRNVFVHTNPDDLVKKDLKGLKEIGKRFDAALHHMVLETRNIVLILNKDKEEEQKKLKASMQKQAPATGPKTTPVASK
jgi:hypothetical protein